jgi:hypothetical protein
LNAVKGRIFHLGDSFKHSSTLLRTSPLPLQRERIFLKISTLSVQTCVAVLKSAAILLPLFLHSHPQAVSVLHCKGRSWQVRVRSNVLS